MNRRTALVAAIATASISFAPVTAQTLYWSDQGQDRIRDADLDGGNAGVSVTLTAGAIRRSSTSIRPTSGSTGTTPATGPSVGRTCKALPR